MGAGSALKLCVNQGIGVLAAGLGETLRLGRDLGLDRTLLLDVLGTTAYGWTLQQKRSMLDADDYADTQFSLDLLAKDLALALDAGTGEVRWRSALAAPARSAPTVADGRLFINLLDGKLLALNAATGERQWAHQSEVASTALLGQPAPAYADGLVVAGFGTGELVAVRAESGGLAWSDSLASSRGRNSLLDLSAIHALPVVEAGRVYAIGLGGLMVSIDLRSGRRLWEREVGGTETPYLAGDWLFVQSAEQSLAAVHKDDGRVGWITELPRYEDPGRRRDPILWTGPVMGAGILVLAGSNERLTAVLAESGKVINTFRLAGAASVPPIAAGGSVYVVTDDGSIQAFR